MFGESLTKSLNLSVVTQVLRGVCQCLKDVWGCWMCSGSTLRTSLITSHDFGSGEKLTIINKIMSLGSNNRHHIITERSAYCFLEHEYGLQKSNLPHWM